MQLRSSTPVIWTVCLDLMTMARLHLSLPSILSEAMAVNRFWLGVSGCTFSIPPTTRCFTGRCPSEKQGPGKICACWKKLEVEADPDLYGAALPAVPPPTYGKATDGRLRFVRWTLTKTVW